MIHELKTLKAYFDQVKSGAKTFEVRRNDRGFHVGHTLRLHAIDNLGIITNEDHVNVKVVYMYEGALGGLEPGYCVMGIELKGEE